MVPGLASVTLDFRDPDAARLAVLERRIAAVAQRVADAGGVGVVWRPDERIEPMPLAGRVRDAVRRAAAELGYSHVDIPSGAGHDSQNMAHIAPTGMIFVPSKDGRSHSPAEYTDPADVERGANVLLSTVLTLAGG